MQSCCLRLQHDRSVEDMAACAPFFVPVDGLMRVDDGTDVRQVVFRKDRVAVKPSALRHLRADMHSFRLMNHISPTTVRVARQHRGGSPVSAWAQS